MDWTDGGNLNGLGDALLSAYRDGDHDSALEQARYIMESFITHGDCWPQKPGAWLIQTANTIYTLLVT